MAVRVPVESGNRPHEIEEVYLGDDGPFEFVVPKIGGIMSVARSDKTGEELEQESIRAQTKWLQDGFDPEDWADILDRLDDPEDNLDWPHMFRLFEALMASQGERPTTSSGDSSATPRRLTGAAARKRRERTSTTTPPEDSAI